MKIILSDFLKKNKKIKKYVESNSSSYTNKKDHPFFSSKILKKTYNQLFFIKSISLIVKSSIKILKFKTIVMKTTK